VGILISLFSFVSNDVLLPAGTVQFSRLWRRILFSSPALELESNSVKHFGNTVIITGPVKDKTLRDIMILDRTKEGERRMIIAGQAELEDLGEGRISINLKDAFVQSGKETLKKNYDYASAANLRYIVSQDNFSQTIYPVGPKEMSSVDVRQEIRKKELELQGNLETEFERITRSAQILETALREGRAVGTSLVSDWEYTISSIPNLKRDWNLALYRLEYFKKFSIPFGALSFVLVAVSVGLLANKGGQTVGFIIGICISALYWALLLIGQELGTRLNFSPFWAMWFPNVMAITAGLILLMVRAVSR